MSLILWQKTKAALSLFARAEVLTLMILWLIVLVVVGTISQRYVGLYLSQQKYFSSVYFLLGNFIPLPGGYTVISIISLGLLVKLAKDKWTTKQAGTIILHLGALLLLFGGLLTALYSQEGNMVIPEGEKSSFISDYYKIEIAVVEITPDKNDNIVTVFSEGWLKPKSILQNDNFPFTMEIVDYCRNCDVTKRKKTPENENLQAMAKFFILENLPIDKEYEKNRAGITMRITGDEDYEGVYSIFEFMPIQQYIRTDNKKYLIDIRHKRTYLPFSIRLLDFDRSVHPGTDTPRSFSSSVVLEENDVAWNSLIKMNEPLHYRGYTFYQSSFIEESADNQTTVLAVVKNISRQFPYIASIIMSIGLLIHLLQRLPILIKKARTDNEANKK